MSKSVAVIDGKNVAVVTLENCMDCQHHQVVRDPDPTDSFNSDDEAVLCGITPNLDNTLYYARKVPFENKPITVSCRPYSKRKECEIPDWCPFKA